MEILKIHEHPNFLDECCDLINMEWPRSKTARLRVLQQSSDSIPMSLIMVKDCHVIGHSKLTPLPAEPDACFIESVVIHPAHRGQGRGKAIMTASENEARRLGLHTIYLSTIDQQGFYWKLGYTDCHPVSVYGSPALKWNTTHNVTNMSGPSSELKSPHKSFSSPKKDKLPSFLNAPPPPPPPPPESSRTLSPSIGAQNKKTFMKKYLNDNGGH